MQKIQITSDAFQNGSPIPLDYTCDGEDRSPSLKWSNVPAGTQSLAILADDPDAPAGDWVHWVLYNLPPKVTELPAGIAASELLAKGCVLGKTDFGSVGYGGPCPPRGVHRYFFKIYALDQKLSLETGKTKSELLQAMKGHVLAEGQLMGTYERMRSGGRR